MRLPTPAPGYDANDQAQLRRTLEIEFGGLLKKPTAPPVVKGSKGGNAALTSLIAALVQLGLVKDQTT